MSFTSYHWTAGTGTGGGLDAYANFRLGTGFFSGSHLWSITDSTATNKYIALVSNAITSPNGAYFVVCAANKAVFTSNSVLDDGSGNMKVSGYLKVSGATAPPSLTSIFAGSSNSVPYVLSIGSNADMTGADGDRLTIATNAGPGNSIELDYDTAGSQITYSNGSSIKDSQVFYNNGVLAFQLGDGSSIPTKVITANNILDDGSGNIKPLGYKSSDGSQGVSGTFAAGGHTLTIKDGIITSIV
jgi:hypothetical protein